MKPTIEILENIKRNSERNKNEVFTRLYRYLLRPDIYYVAYKNLYSNSGAATKGINNDTVDGFSEKKIENIIKFLTDETYIPSPARRIYIKKANGKLRPLGIPTFTDKLIQEALRMMLEAVYEPVFLDCSHGFRPNRSCHTALNKIKYGFNGVRWFIEGDIKSCFDTINHSKLVGVINAKIKDARLIKLIWKLLKAGYLDNWEYHKTQSGSPQGGICSPIFANIYLHELDKFVSKQIDNFDKPEKDRRTTDYKKIERKKQSINRQLKKAQGELCTKLIKQKKALKKKQLKIPSKSQTDKRMRYIRYADDFIIGICGNKEDCQTIKQQLSDFICNTMRMELSDEKTLITHSSLDAKFLGYDISVRRENKAMRKKGKSCIKRTLNNKVNLSIPFDDKIMKFLFDNKIIRQKQDGKIIPTYRPKLLTRTDLGIVSAFNAELRGICNFYSIASNFYKLNYFAYLMEYSCLLTLGVKYNNTIGQTKFKFKDGNGKWCIPYKTKTESKRCYFANYTECKNSNKLVDVTPNILVRNYPTRTIFESRLVKKTCELCKTTKAENYEIHHVPKLKDLKGEKEWEQVMIKKRKKTLVICESCHEMIHS